MNSAPMNGHKPKAAVLDKPRARRDAAKVLAVALQTRYRKLLEASGEDEIVIATTDLAQTLYENIEFVIWALKVQGGMNPPAPEQLRKVTPPKPAPANDPQFAKPPAFELQEPAPANDPQFAKPPAFELQEPPVPDVCICPPLEMGLIGRERHMTSCPKYVP